MKVNYSFKKYIFYFIFPILLAGCKQKDRASKYIRDLNSSDTFRYEFTVNQKGAFDSVEYKYLKEFENFQKLPSLEKGFDSIQIRISYGCNMGSELLVILSNQSNHWKAEVRRVGDNYMDRNLQIHPVLTKVEYRTPKSGWEDFINKLFGLKILSLEDNQKIPGFKYDIPADGCYMIVEVATKNTYRFYSYENPDLYNDKYWQANNILEILKLINKELDIDTDWPSDKSEKSKIEKQVKIPEIELKDVKADSTKN